MPLPRRSISTTISTRGESFFQELIAPFAITHKTENQNDIGVDYFCEWMRTETEHSFEPSNVLFAVQLKTSEKSNVEVISQGQDRGRNFLDKFEIKRKNGQDRDDIQQKTKEYFKGFDIPVYLFVVLLSDSGNEIYYRRYTPILHDDPDNEIKFYYKVNNMNSFLAFATEDNKGGFCRDLFIDYIRCNYNKGSIAYKNPRELGLNQFLENENTVFIDMASDQYRDKIQNTINKLKSVGFLSAQENLDLTSSTSTGSGTQEPFVV